MDYRYETKNEARDFHKQRKSFIIINGEVKYIPEGSEMSHFEFCSSIGYYSGFPKKQPVHQSNRH